MEYCKFARRAGISVQKDEAPAPRAGGGVGMLGGNPTADPPQGLGAPGAGFKRCRLGRADGGAGRRAC